MRGLLSPSHCPSWDLRWRLCVIALPCPHHWFFNESIWDQSILLFLVIDIVPFYHYQSKLTLAYRSICAWEIFQGQNCLPIIKIEFYFSTFCAFHLSFQIFWSCAFRPMLRAKLSCLIPLIIDKFNIDISSRYHIINFPTAKLFCLC